ncbi:hypothetical protein CKM354_000209900 [Cercospora kikuchii]|uniref:ML-like domain-containing protein n=1 Tax=Cercospora kikuchii TaxID=84275 RepID=A0A9P3CC69_9PEZI|nr:uncharacterized protein CKM354_000209900 [Cercospora kikuchii]GIZ38692.1 hypothetical protein CKM354_000209900 [Cercospora kikuchii]
MARLFHNALVLATLATILSFTHAQRALYSIENSTSTCISNSSITADIFSASITPDNNTIGYDVFGTFNYSGPVLLSYILTVNSETALNITEDPCLGTGASSYLCPASPGQIALNSNINTPAGDLDTIPEDVYTTSNPDANFRYVMTNAESGEIVGCLQTNLTNDASMEANSTETGGSGANSTGNGNGTGSGNETGGAQSDESDASTAYLNWTLLGSAIIALACGGVL